MSRSLRNGVRVTLLMAAMAVPGACRPDPDDASSTSGDERPPVDGGVSDGGPSSGDAGRSIDGGVGGDAGRRGGGMAVGDVSIGTTDDAAVSDEPAQRGDAGATVDAGASSPWGASRDERCAAPPRPTLTSSGQQSFAEAVALATRGDVAGATTRFEQLMQQDRRAYRAAYNLGVLADRQGREEAALDYYRQSLRIVPSYEDAIDAIVLLHIRRGRLTEALSFVAPLSVQFAWNARIQATHSRVLGEMSRWDEAFREARRGLSCDERSVPALTALARSAIGQGNLDLGSWILDRLAQVESTDQVSEVYAESHFLRGQVARGRPGELQRAIDEFDRAIQLRPDYVDARMALGQLLLLSGAYDVALRHLEAAAMAAPWSWSVRLAYADGLRSLRRWDAARTELDRVATLAPDQPEVRLSRGLLFLEQANCLRTGDVAAIPTCQRALGEFNAYRAGMGARLPANDRSYEYSQGLTRILQRLNAAAQAQQPSQGATDAPPTETP